MQVMLQERFMQNLETLMRERGFSQSELARRMSVSPQYVQKYLRGTSSPGLDVLERFSSALDLDDPCELLRAEVSVAA